MRDAEVKQQRLVHASSAAALLHYRAGTVNTAPSRCWSTPFSACCGLAEDFREGAADDFFDATLRGQA